MSKFIISLSIIVLFNSCGSKNKNMVKEDTVKTRTTSENLKPGTKSSALDWYDIENEDHNFFKLSDELKEISGITFTADNRLFAHGDEDADIFQLDPQTGEIIKRFSLGEFLVLKGDFEDITWVNNKFYLMESKGNIYEFSEGSNGQFVTYKKYKTELNSANNVEGLCYDNSTKSLLMVCKDYPGDGYEKQKAVYTFSLSSMTMEPKPRFLISLKSIKKNTIENEFSPSGIAKNPVSETFFIIAARGNTILELNKEGELINQKDLPEKIHKQAEGIAFMSDGTLYISDEGKNKTARLVKYIMNK
jgi:uncharacterized protein YjiK